MVSINGATKEVLVVFGDASTLLLSIGAILSGRGLIKTLEHLIALVRTAEDSIFLGCDVSGGPMLELFFFFFLSTNGLGEEWWWSWTLLDKLVFQ